MRSARRITVELDEADALQVGLSLRTLVHTKGISASAIAVYDRVGTELIKAAQKPNPPVEVAP